MAQPTIEYGDFIHAGAHSFQQAPVVPAGAFGNDQIGTTNPIETNKLKHRFDPVHAQPNGTAATTERKVIHVARSAGAVSSVDAGYVTAGAAGSTVTVDLKKNGTTILTGAITLTVTDPAYTRTAGVLAGGGAPSYVAGDVFELVITATVGSGTLPQGVFAAPVFSEGPA